MVMRTSSSDEDKVARNIDWEYSCVLKVCPCLHASFIAVYILGRMLLVHRDAR